jgi:hypothetical protein
MTNIHGVQMGDIEQFFLYFDEKKYTTHLVLSTSMYLIIEIL